MKLVSYRTSEGDDFGIVVDDGVIPLKDRLSDGCDTLREALAKDLLGNIKKIAAVAKPTVRLADLPFLPVIPQPTKFLAVGINFYEHAAQIERKVEARPGLFVRFSDTLVGHKQPMIRPRVSQMFDFEGELAVIIGKSGRYIAESEAMQYVAGYACFVDGSLRDYQKQSTTAGKNFPSTGPFGPWMVTADEIPDPRVLVLTTWLNGKIVQQAGIDMMIHPIPTMISYLSEITVLEPGDVISMGTPGGVGHKRNPPLWLKAGDLLEVDISKIGTLSNHVIDEPS